jgi:hypothetical protein
MTKKARKEQRERRLARQATAREFITQLRNNATALPDVMVPEDAIYIIAPGFAKELKVVAGRMGIRYSAFTIGPKPLPSIKKVDGQRLVFRGSKAVGNVL